MPTQILYRYLYAQFVTIPCQNTQFFTLFAVQTQLVVPYRPSLRVCNREALYHNHLRSAPSEEEADHHPAGPGPLLGHPQAQPRPLRGAQGRERLEGTRTRASQGK